jgi:hypothetical protein
MNFTNPGLPMMALYPQSKFAQRIFSFSRHDAEEGGVRLVELFEWNSQALERLGEGDVDDASPVH